eukprot:9757162-Alexandrium_andersonii.AAC.1
MKLMQSLENYDSKAVTKFFQPNKGRSNASGSGSSSSAPQNMGMDKLKMAYEAMSACERNIQTLVKGLMGWKDLSQTGKDSSGIM